MKFFSETIRFHRLSLFFLIAIIFGFSAAEAGLRGISVVPTQPSDSDYQQYSSIHNVDGYAFLSEEMTISETRQAALSNAKHMALEMAKNYISSKTSINDFMTSDAVSSEESAKSVLILEQKDLGIEDNSRYHVWIKAEVFYEADFSPSETAEYAIKDSGSLQQPLEITPDAPLTVKIWTEKKVYQKDEYIKIFMQGNRNYYAKIVDITANGDIVQLLPNKYRKSSLFKAGQVYQIPDGGDQFQLKVTPPYGDEKIRLFASEHPLGDVSLNKIQQGLSIATTDEKTFARQTRGFTIAPKKLSQEGLPQGLNGVQFFQSNWVISTQE